MKRNKGQNKNAVSVHLVCCMIIGMSALVSCNEKKTPSSHDYLDPEFEWDDALEGKVDIQGIVTDELGYPLSYVTVSSGGDAMETSPEGLFVLANVPPGEAVVRATSKTQAYVTQSISVTVEEDGGAPIVLSLLPTDEGVWIPGASGGTVKGRRGAEVTLPPNAFLDPSGRAVDIELEVMLTPIDPARPEERLAAPGDFTGVVDGELVALESFGMLDIRARNAYGNLSLAPGTAFQVSIPLSEEVENPEATVPLWWFDESTAKWIPAGDAVMDETSRTYKATISQLGTWNLDKALTTTCVTGRVLTGDGAPLPDVTVRADGVGYLSRATSRTDPEGRFFARVKVGADIVVSGQEYIVSGWPPALHSVHIEATTVTATGNALGDPAAADGVTCQDVGDLIAVVRPFDDVFIEGDVDIHTEADVTALENIERIDGVLNIEETALTRVSLPHLKRVSELRINNNDALTELDFPNLVWVGQLYLRSNDLLTDLNGLSAIAGVGILYITGRTALNDLGALSGIEHMTYIYIEDTEGLKNFKGLEGLSRVSCLWAWRNDSLESLEGLDNLVDVGNSLTLYRNHALEDITALRKLENVGFSLSIFGNPNLESLDGLENLHRMGEVFAEGFDTGFSVKENPMLPTCEAHRVLEHIDFERAAEVCISGNVQDQCEERPCD
jgi:hypothetical protein